VSSDHQNREFIAQFLADYYAESDEHLTLVRRNLLALEMLLTDPSAATDVLDELFRSFHTLKGISGMVGLSEAEQVAHHLESYLRSLRQEGVPITRNGISVMMDATALLEKVIAARRNEEPIPNIEWIVAKLNEVIPSALNPSSSATSDRSAPTETTVRPKPGLKTGTRERTWTITFTPSLALTERGINVNIIRAKIQEIGTLLRSTPQVRSEGEIAFEFVVRTDADRSVFAGWGIDSLSYELVGDVSDSEVLLEETGALQSPGYRDPILPSSMLASASVVRVDLTRLDELMRMIGELVSSRARLHDKLKQLQRKLSPADWRPLQETSLAMERQLRDLREGVLRVRMVQIGEIFERMQFVVHDLARENNKEIKLEMFGKNTEIDKFLVERMTDPLLHLVRNAVSHGLEPADERRAQGKPVVSTLSLSAEAMGETIVIKIADDGRGIDVDGVIRRARERGLVSNDAEVDDRALLSLLCSPGLSTRDQADRESGRGVGMDVVAKAVREVGGTLSLETVKNRGTSFRIELPLTLAIAEAMIAMVGDQRFAVPQAAVREIVAVEPGTVKVLENNEIISYRGGVLPLVRLTRLFDLEGRADRDFHVFVVGNGSNALGIVVDRVVGQREIVVRGLNDPLVQMPGIAGATELGDERVVLILDVGALRQLAVAS